MASYRDVAARGVPPLLAGSSSSNNNNNGFVPTSRGPFGSVGFAPVQPDQALLTQVVASVLAVLAGKGQHF